MDSLDSLHWGLLGMIALLTVSVLLLTHSHRELDRRVATRELASPSPEELRSTASESRHADDECRRAHVRLDNQERELQALARQLGWSDDRARTRLLGSPSEPPPGVR